jgi:hypothetical protein
MLLNWKEIWSKLLKAMLNSPGLGAAVNVTLVCVGTGLGSDVDGTAVGLAVGATLGSTVGGGDWFGQLGGGALCGLQIRCFVGLRLGAGVGSTDGAEVSTATGEDGQSKDLVLAERTVTSAPTMTAHSNHPLVSRTVLIIIVTQRRSQEEMKFDHESPGS